MKSIEHITNDFYNSIGDIKSFEIFGINIIKICFKNYFDKQFTGIKFREVTVKKKKIVEKNRIQRYKENLLLLKLRLTKKIVFVGVAGRTLKIDNLEYDIYNFNLINYFKNDILYLEDNQQDTKKLFTAKYHKKDFTTIYNSSWQKLKINEQEDKQLIHDFLTNLKKKNPDFVLELDEIQQSIWHFLRQHTYYDLLIQKIKPKKIFLICHYGKEDLIAAAKKNNVEVVEFQHGGVLLKHPFYNLPQIPYATYLFNHAAFPDKICVYGQKWKDILLKGKLFKAENIIISGYYQKSFDSEPKNKTNPKSVILITTQATVQEEWLKYVVFLKEQLNPNKWKVIIKPHPSEGFDEYQKIIDDKLVFLSFDNVYELLNQVDIHITVYSSLVFEATRYKVANYSLYVEKYKNECKEITDLKVAKRLNNNEIPKVYNSNIDSSRFYEKFPTDEFLKFKKTF